MIRAMGIWYALILLFTASIVPLNVLDGREEGRRLVARSLADGRAFAVARELRDLDHEWSRQPMEQRPIFAELLKQRMGSDVKVTHEGTITVRQGDAEFKTSIDQPGGWSRTFPLIIERPLQPFLGFTREGGWVIGAFVWALLLLNSFTVRPRAMRPRLALFMVAISLSVYATAASVSTLTTGFLLDRPKPTEWAAMMAGASVLALLWNIGYRVRRGNAFPTCSTCGYNLTGNVSGVCPECGKGIKGLSVREGRFAAPD